MSQVKHWLIVYDIRNSKRLSKVEKCVESYAWRVQKSIFESNATDETINQLKNRLNQIIDDEVDFVLFFQVCERDWQKQEKFGIGSRIKEQIPDDSFAIL